MKTFTVKIKRSVYTFPLEDIVYMENELRKIRMHLTDGEYLFYGTFREARQQLDERFLQCSRSYILNKDHIRAMRQNGYHEIIMDNGGRIPLCRSTFSRAKSEFESYLRQSKGRK